MVDKLLSAVFYWQKNQFELLHGELLQMCTFTSAMAADKGIRIQCIPWELVIGGYVIYKSLIPNFDIFRLFL